MEEGREEELESGEAGYEVIYKHFILGLDVFTQMHKSPSISPHL